MTEEVVEIHVLDKKVRLLQPAAGFRTSLDSVMLAAACSAKAGQRILDMGCGVGGAAFCLLHRVPDCYVTGVDIEEDYIRLARQNIALNGADGRADFLVSDIRDFALPDPAQRFDHIICNPPYLEAGHYTPSPQEKKAVALGHREADMRLKDWIDAGFHLLQSGGSLTVIHRADTVDRIIQGMGRRFGALTIIPLWPRASEPAKRVIVSVFKDRKTPAVISPGIILHDQEGGYTVQADDILRRGQAIA